MVNERSRARAAAGDERPAHEREPVTPGESAAHEGDGRPDAPERAAPAATPRKPSAKRKRKGRSR